MDWEVCMISFVLLLRRGYQRIPRVAKSLFVIALFALVGFRNLDRFTDPGGHLAKVREKELKEQHIREAKIMFERAQFLENLNPNQVDWEAGKALARCKDFLAQKWLTPVDLAIPNDGFAKLEKALAYREAQKARERLYNDQDPTATAVLLEALRAGRISPEEFGETAEGIRNAHRNACHVQTMAKLEKARLTLDLPLLDEAFRHISDADLAGDLPASARDGDIIDNLYFKNVLENREEIIARIALRKIKKLLEELETTKAYLPQRTPLFQSVGKEDPLEWIDRLPIYVDDPIKNPDIATAESDKISHSDKDVYEYDELLEQMKTVRGFWESNHIKIERMGQIRKFLSPEESGFNSKESRMGRKTLAAIILKEFDKEGRRLFQRISQPSDWAKQLETVEDVHFYKHTQFLAMRLGPLDPGVFLWISNELDYEAWLEAVPNNKAASILLEWNRSRRVTVLDHLYGETNDKTNEVESNVSEEKKGE